MQEAFGIVIFGVVIIASLVALTTLASEVRELVMARSRRRVKQGEEPLDVEAEVSRQLAELD